MQKYTIFSWFCSCYLAPSPVSRNSSNSRYMKASLNLYNVNSTKSCRDVACRVSCQVSVLPFSSSRRSNSIIPARENAAHCVSTFGYTQDIQAISRPTQMSGFVAAPHLVFRYETHSTTNQKAWCSDKNYSFPISSSSRIHYPLIDSSRTWQLDA